MTEAQLRRLCALEERAKYKNLGPIPFSIDRTPRKPGKQSSSFNGHGVPSAIIFKVCEPEDE